LWYGLIFFIALLWGNWLHWWYCWAIGWLIALAIGYMGLIGAYIEFKGA